MRVVVSSFVGLLFALLLIYVLRPVNAGPLQSQVTASTSAAPALSVAWPPEGGYPSPQEPLDTTPITPFETVGGLPYEP